jgi:prepilin peptidase CpaA
MLVTLALFIFPVLMAYAASSDLLTMRIANWLVVLVVLAYLGLALLLRLPWEQIGWAAVAALAVLLVAFAFFAFGWIGGGDAKLVSATVMWIGTTGLLQYLIYAALLGGALTLIILAFRRYPMPAWLLHHKWVDRLHDTRSGVPYGVALAIAAILVYPETAIFGALIGS